MAQAQIAAERLFLRVSICTTYTFHVVTSIFQVRLELGFDWVVFVLNKETRQDANALKKILGKTIRKPDR
jgi:hypothetical protein